jgi:hypothetical protein
MLPLPAVFAFPTTSSATLCQHPLNARSKDKRGGLDLRSTASHTLWLSLMLLSSLSVCIHAERRFQPRPRPGPAQEIVRECTEMAFVKADGSFVDLLQNTDSTPMDWFLVKSDLSGYWTHACIACIMLACMQASCGRCTNAASFLIIFFAVRRGDNLWAQLLRVCAVVRKCPWWSSL